MQLYVIRHGQTDCNRKKQYNCRYDEDINEIGIEQAKTASAFVQKLDIDFIICSPMIRTRHTCDLININKIPVFYEEKLIERDGGKLTLTTIDDYFFQEYYNYYSTNIVDGLESLPELFKRIHSFLDELKEQYKKNTILLVTHGAVARAIQFYFEPLPEDGMILKKGGQGNCEIKKYEL